MINKLNILIDEWEKEGTFLNGPEDDPFDRACGKTYQICAKQLKEVIKHASQPTNQQEQVDIMPKHPKGAPSIKRLFNIK